MVCCDTCCLIVVSARGWFGILGLSHLLDFLGVVRVLSYSFSALFVCFRGWVVCWQL